MPPILPCKAEHKMNEESLKGERSHPKDTGLVTFVKIDLELPKIFH